MAEDRDVLAVGSDGAQPIRVSRQLDMERVAQWSVEGNDLAALILSRPALQTNMKLIGSAYLLWLAWQTSRRGRPNFAQDVAKPVTALGGIGLLWINPKGWAMTLSAAASFTAIANGPFRFALVLRAVFLLLSALSLVLWCVAGLLLSRLLRSEAQWRVLNIVLGTLLAVSIIPIWLE